MFILKTFYYIKEDGWMNKWTDKQKKEGRTKNISNVNFIGNVVLELVFNMIDDFPGITKLTTHKSKTYNCFQ